MSLLDTIKSLFFKNESEVPEPEVRSAAEQVSEPDSPAQPAVEEKPAKVAAVSKSSAAGKLQVPEDSALRRHFLAKLIAEIEEGLPPRPSDSTLKRHYDGIVQSELDKMLG